jgi:hypothetical protein
MKDDSRRATLPRVDRLEEAILLILAIADADPKDNLDAVWLAPRTRVQLENALRSDDDFIETRQRPDGTWEYRRGNCCIWRSQMEIRTLRTIGYRTEGEAVEAGLKE